VFHWVVSWPLAPAIHPVSSGSWGWGWVLGQSVIMGRRGGVAAANEINVSTHHPPREQGLAAVVVGGCHCWGSRSVVVTWSPVIRSLPRLSFVCRGGPPRSSCVVLPSIVIGGAPLAPMIHPASSGLQGWGWVLGHSFVPTLRAGARSGGGGGWLSLLFGPW
jgi:hypothetical protein